MTNILIRAWLMIALGGAAVQNAQPQVVPLDESGSKGRIRVLVVNSFGDPLLSATVRVEGVGEHSSGFTQRLEGATSGALPYGRYRIVAKMVNHSSSTVEIDLNEPGATAVIGLVPYALLSSQSLSTVKGTVEGHLSSDCHFLRMIPLFTSGPAYDASVLNNQFIVVGAKPGQYALTLLGPSGICRFSQAVVGLGGGFVSITIP